MVVQREMEIKRRIVVTRATHQLQLQLKLAISDVNWYVVLNQQNPAGCIAEVFFTSLTLRNGLHGLVEDFPFQNKGAFSGVRSLLETLSVSTVPKLLVYINTIPFEASLCGSRNTHAQHLVAVSVERLRKLESWAQRDARHVFSVHFSRGKYKLGNFRSYLSDLQRSSFSLLHVFRVINHKQLLARSVQYRLHRIRYLLLVGALRNLLNVCTLLRVTVPLRVVVYLGMGVSLSVTLSMIVPLRMVVYLMIVDLRMVMGVILGLVVVPRKGGVLLHNTNVDRLEHLRDNHAGRFFLVRFVRVLHRHVRRWGLILLGRGIRRDIGRGSL